MNFPTCPTCGFPTGHIESGTGFSVSTRCSCEREVKPFRYFPSDPAWKELIQYLKSLGEDVDQFTFDQIYTAISYGSKRQPGPMTAEQLADCQKHCGKAYVLALITIPDEILKLVIF